MAKIIENKIGRRLIKLSTDDVISLVREYQTLTKNIHDYAIIRNKERKSYIKNHISIDADSRSILHFAAPRGPRFDTRFLIAAIRNIKKYNPKYPLADRAHDIEPIKKCTNEEAKAED